MKNKMIYIFISILLNCNDPNVWHPTKFSNGTEKCCTKMFGNSFLCSDRTIHDNCINVEVKYNIVCSQSE